MTIPAGHPAIPPRKIGVLLTNLGTGNRILIPLRYPCKPPLKGEVGYCRY